MFIKVDLPEPLEPISATNSPWPISIETPRTACTSTSPVRYVLRTSSSRTATASEELFMPLETSRAAAAEGITRGSRRRAAVRHTGHDAIAFFQTLENFRRHAVADPGLDRSGGRLFRCRSQKVKRALPATLRPISRRVFPPSAGARRCGAFLGRAPRLVWEAEKNRAVRY